MAKHWLALVLFGGIAGGVMATLFGGVVSPRLTEATVRSIVDESLESRAPAGIAAADLGPAIEKYLLENPSVLEAMSEKLQASRAAEQRAETRAAIADLGPIIADGEAAVDVGNPSGDVTLVEMYDYNCGYCRNTLPDIAALLAEDKELRLVLRQFPILSQASLDAAKVGLLVARQGGDYWAFHRAMFTARGQVTLDTALAAAETLGLDRDRLEAGLSDQGISDAIAESFEIAQRLKINGTPSFILADEVIPGAIGIDALREKIQNVRTCGSTRCSP